MYNINENLITNRNIMLSELQYSCENFNHQRLSTQKQGPQAFSLMSMVAQRIGSPNLVLDFYHAYGLNCCIRVNPLKTSQPLFGQN